MYEDRYCDSELVRGECPGHFGGKFDSCLAEALWVWSLDQGYPDGTTGDSEFDGHLAMFLVERREEAEIDPDGSDGRVVAVPPDSYLLWTANSGAVTLEVAGSRASARATFDYIDQRYGLWERGCDPEHPEDHEGCADHDVCQHPEWMDRR